MRGSRARKGKPQLTETEVVRWDAEQVAAEASFRRFRWLLLPACVVLIACAILGPTVGVVGPGVFGRGATLGFIVLAVVLLGAASLAVLWVWGFSVGGRPWRTNLPRAVTVGSIVQGVIVGLALAVLVLLVVLWTLWSFGAPVL